MNWQHLRYFEVVSKEEHITRAAERLHVTQSALSKAIDMLEKELGVPLFERSGRNIRLNKYGRIFRNHVIFATNEIDKGVETIQSMAKINNGTVSFSSIFSMGASFVPELIKDFTKKYPNIHLLYYQKSTKDILNNLLDGEIEFGFCGEFPRDDEYESIDSELVLVEELVLAVPEDHRLAGRSSVSFGELLDEEFVGYTENTGIIHSIDEVLSSAGYDSSCIKQSYKVAEDNTVAAMVRAGLGIAIIANNPTFYTEGIRLIPITDPYMSRKLYMVWNRNGYMSPAAKTFKYHVLALANDSLSSKTTAD